MLFNFKNKICIFIVQLRKMNFNNIDNKINNKNLSNLYKIFILYIIFDFVFFYKKSYFFDQLNYLKKNNFYYLFKNKIFFNCTYLIYYFSYKFNIVQILYNISFYDKNNRLIKPSNLALFYKLHILCHIKRRNNLMNIDSLANIFQNRQFICINFFRIKEKIKFGIRIYKENEENFNFTIYFFSSRVIKYRNKFINNNIFNPFIINREYKNLYKKIQRLEKNKDNQEFSPGLKKLYIEKPIFLYEMNNILENKKWYFKNIYNKYFCFCKGYCKYSEIQQLCKYRLYLNIIDNNKNIYNKTDYLLADFYYFSSDDAYPIFKEMLRQKLRAHYMDAKKSIYQKFCRKQRVCLKIIPMVNINGNFLEKYLDIILKLKAVITGHPVNSFYNLFYSIDYITYINLGHGVKYFKHFLYNNYTSFKNYNKILLPPSKKVISIAKRYGWIDNNIIKICLPKWDKYDLYKQKNFKDKKNKSIFIMFTWRNLINQKYKISSKYFNGIIDLINNKLLNKVIKKKKITIYFSLHPNFKKYKYKIIFNKLVKYVEFKNISNCLMKSSLIISDFSSVIFDMIYQGKPYIIFIPDAYDNKIKYIYEKGYYEIINSLKNGTIDFENKYFNVKKTVNKIIFYIKNNFKLEKKLKKFYESFTFNCKNNTNKFINYLINKIQ